VTKTAAIKVALLWHMHQPNYREPFSNRLAMPWVRLHALKDYLDMPLAATARENVRVTFNLVPTLLDQFEMYANGGTDRHFELSQVSAEDIGAEARSEILRNFFTANPSRMILPFPRYLELYTKYSSAAGEPATLVSLFSSEEIRDLQVWSNLVWVDPRFRQEEPIRTLFATGRHFTEEAKQEFLKWQRGLIGRIIPTYQKLLADNRLEVSFTPYYHPIMPLLCDTDIAREALPSIELPKQRFVHPEDAETQVSRSVEKYRQLFGRDMVGMWPSEGSVSEEVLQIAARHGIKWLASDEEILTHSLTKSGLRQKDNPIHAVYECPNGVRMFFRDHALSDRIGFVYSTWEPARAVSDFIGHIKQLRRIYAGQLDRVVVPIILDGENAWEYFPDDGTAFLAELYTHLDEDPEIETVTFSEAVSQIPAHPLPRLFAGSWINHNFRIWIGHSEDNHAWDLLSQTRDDLVTFQRSHPDYGGGKLAQAWEEIYIAEGSDWCWWYGDDHRGAGDEQFDRVYRRHLSAVYELLGLDVPLELLRPISSRAGRPRATMPDGLITPTVDGRLTHFYEWAGAGHFDCRLHGGTMHRVENYISDIFFGYDRTHVYIRLDFYSGESIKSNAGLKVELTCFVPEKRVIELSLERPSPATAPVTGVFGDRVEFGIERVYLWPAGFGDLSITATLLQGDQRLEIWPEHEPISLVVPRRFEEAFWPT
jgi:alpha-amylase/alpha-mannosidase (GH57 family)